MPAGKYLGPARMSGGKRTASYLSKYRGNKSLQPSIVAGRRLRKSHAKGASLKQRLRSGRRVTGKVLRKGLKAGATAAGAVRLLSAFTS